MTALIVFAKPPRPGLVKTRLIPDIGAKRATDVYRYCLQHALNIAKKSALEYHVYLTEPSDDSLLQAHSCKPQTGDNLGERMHHAIQEIADQGKHTIVIGSDCLDIDVSHIRRAAQALETRDMVILPAYDGGYALIGCRRAETTLFDGVDWSTATVLQQTLDNATRLGWQTCQLETVRDIDTLSDVKHYPELIRLIETESCSTP